MYTESTPSPDWGRVGLPEIAGRTQGFHPTSGYHLYCELRPVKSFEATDDDDEAATFLKILDIYAQMGAEAAASFDLLLLEHQGMLLHFFKEGQASSPNTDEIVDFAHSFTASAYRELRPVMDDEWHGFAAAFDHGSCILINHGGQHAESTVSLGPSANRPAKRLFGGAPAGHITAPATLVRHIIATNSEWAEINLRDRKVSPTESTQNLDAQFSQIRRRVIEGDQGITEFSADLGQDVLRMTPDNPQRLVGSAVRCDLDGFTALIERAFAAGPEVVQGVALGFRSIMDHAVVIAQAHQPCVMLPWAGDCVTFLLPDLPELQRSPRWLEFSMDWLSTDSNGARSPLFTNRVLDGIKWGIGAAHGDSGNIVISSTVIQNHRFVVAAGHPQAAARSAQDTAKGNEVAIDSSDYTRLTQSSKALFDKKNKQGFWVADKPSRTKIQEKASILGVAATAPAIKTSVKSAIPSPPPNRPYFA